MINPLYLGPRSSAPDGPLVLLVGTNETFQHFLDSCASVPRGKLFVTAPYFDGDFLDRLANRFLASETTLEVILRSSDEAQRFIDATEDRGWHTVEMLTSSTLHAKVYIYEIRPRSEVLAWIGSQNPTRAGLCTNIEAGVFLRAGLGSRHGRMLLELREQLRSTGTRYVPSAVIRAVGQEADEGRAQSRPLHLRVTGLRSQFSEGKRVTPHGEFRHGA